MKLHVNNNKKRVVQLLLKWYAWTDPMSAQTVQSPEQTLAIIRGNNINYIKTNIILIN